MASKMETTTAVITAFNIFGPLIADVIIDLRKGRASEDDVKKIISRVRTQVAKNRKRNQEIRDKINNRN